MQPDRERWQRVRWLLGRAEINRAVFFALLLRGWQLAAGAVSALLIATQFSPSEQGYWYTFSGLIALQSFFELGFSMAVINMASHEWSKLSLDEEGRITGDSVALSRLISLGRLLFRWYALASLLFVVLIGAFGLYFLAGEQGAAGDWNIPWVAAAVLSGLLLWTLPFVALLEGCNQVATVNRFRLIQAVVANLTVWTTIVLGAGLWAFVAVTAARLLCELYLLVVKYRRFFTCLMQSPLSERMSWRGEVLPLQWRLAVGGVFQYFSMNFITLVMFRYEGATIAGQMGMTWMLMTTLGMACMSWVQARVPQFGMLVARKEFAELDRRFKRLTLVSWSAVAVAGLALWGAVYSLQHFGWNLGTRLLPPLPTGILIIAVLLRHVPDCFNIYIRAHKREPMSLLALIVTSNSAIGVLVWLLGGYLELGATGAVAGYLGVVALIMFPGVTLIWWRCRRAWH
jgi:hypothetical protein